MYCSYLLQSQSLNFLLSILSFFLPLSFVFASLKFFPLIVFFFSVFFPCLHRWPANFGFYRIILSSCPSNFTSFRLFLFLFLLPSVTVSQKPSPLWTLFSSLFFLSSFHFFSNRRHYLGFSSCLSFLPVCSVFSSFSLSQEPSPVSTFFLPSFFTSFLLSFSCWGDHVPMLRDVKKRPKTAGSGRAQWLERRNRDQRSRVRVPAGELSSPGSTFCAD